MILGNPNIDKPSTYNWIKIFIPSKNNQLPSIFSVNNPPIEDIYTKLHSVSPKNKVNVFVIRDIYIWIISLSAKFATVDSRTSTHSEDVSALYIMDTVHTHVSAASSSLHVNNWKDTGTLSYIPETLRLPERMW